MDDILQLFMGDIVKEFRNVAFEYVTVHTVPLIKPLHLLTEPVQTEQCAFSNLGGTVVADEYSLQPWHDHIVTKTVLYDLVFERGCLYDPLLRLVDLELVIR